MADYSKEDWVKYIKTHLTEFDIQETGPDGKYHLWCVDITSMANRHYNAHDYDKDIEIAKDNAILKLAGDLYQDYKTPETIGILNDE